MKYTKEVIHRYINNELNPLESTEFQTEMELDPNLRELVKREKLVVNKIKSIFPENEALKSTPPEIEAAIFKTFEKQRKRFWPIILIPALTLAGIVTYKLSGNSLEQKEKTSKVVIEETVKSNTNQKKVIKPHSNTKDLINFKANKNDRRKILTTSYLILPKDFTWGDISSKSGNIFEKISHRYRNPKAQKIFYNQTNRFIPTKNYRDHILSIGHSKKKKFSNTSTEDLNSLLSNFNFETNGPFTYEVSTSPFSNGNTTILRLVTKSRLSQLKITFNGELIKSHRLIGQELLPSKIEKIEPLLPHKNEKITILMFELDLKGTFKTNLLKDKQSKSKSPKRDKDILATASIGNERVDIFYEYRSFRDASPDHSWALGLAALVLRKNKSYPIKKEDLDKILELGIGIDSNNRRRIFLNQN